MPQVIQRHLGDRCLLSTLRKAPALKGPKTLKCFQGSLIRQLIPISKLPGAVRSIAHPIPERCANILPCPALPPPSLLPLTSRPVAWAGEHQLRLTSLRFGLSQFPAEVSLPLFQESLPAQWKDLGSELKITGPQPPAGSIKSPAKSGKQARPQDGMGLCSEVQAGSTAARRPSWPHPSTFRGSRVPPPLSSPGLLSPASSIISPFLYGSLCLQGSTLHPRLTDKLCAGQADRLRPWASRSRQHSCPDDLPPPWLWG